MSRIFWTIPIPIPNPFAFPLPNILPPAGEAAAFAEPTHQPALFASIPYSRLRRPSNRAAVPLAS